MLANTSMIKRPLIEGEHNGNTVVFCGFDEAEFDTVFG